MVDRDNNYTFRKAYPCYPGKQYYGRGSKQLSWNYNYGAFSVAMYGKTSVRITKNNLAFHIYVFSKGRLQGGGQHVLDTL